MATRIKSALKNRGELVNELLPDNVYPWELSENYKNEENLIPAMVVGFKSSKAMDIEDELSENQDGMNLVLTSSSGFLRTLAYLLTDDITKIAQLSYTLYAMMYYDRTGDGWHVYLVDKSVSLEYHPSERIVGHSRYMSVFLYRMYQI
ncbi:MAG: hypothetical protein ACJ0Q6_09595 [Candidatus Azotimanducaceae bacterium]|uniref:Uncharacterized protein n=1 Tax=OM182 bacterium TaxID=2510334 RepID=A0A520S1J0_9GAMM|nr:MAG: hypothetical protein EVA68_04640 [OM182 bacterium]